MNYNRKVTIWNVLINFSLVQKVLLVIIFFIFLNLYVKQLLKVFIKNDVKKNKFIMKTFMISFININHYKIPYY